jgi:hypothetical protein
LIPPADRAPPPFDHIVVAWNGSRQAKRALDDALPFLRAATDVTLLRVGADLMSEDHDAAVLDHLANKGLHAVLAHAPKSASIKARVTRPNRRYSVCLGASACSAARW